MARPTHPFSLQSSRAQYHETPQTPSRQASHQYSANHPLVSVRCIPFRGFQLEPREIKFRLLTLFTLSSPKRTIEPEVEFMGKEATVNRLNRSSTNKTNPTIPTTRTTTQVSQTIIATRTEIGTNARRTPIQLSTWKRKSTTPTTPRIRDQFPPFPTASPPTPRLCKILQV